MAHRASNLERGAEARAGAAEWGLPEQPKPQALQLQEKQAPRLAETDRARPHGSEPEGE